MHHALPCFGSLTYHMLQARLLNGMAVCHMRMGDWSDAESYLLEAYEKDAKNPDTLANLVSASMARPTVMCLSRLRC